MTGNLTANTDSGNNVVNTVIFLDGKKLGTDAGLLQLNVTKVFNKIASAHLVFRDGNVAGREFSLSNQNDFQPGTKIRIQLGYSYAETLFEGVIISHKIQLQPDGNTYLKLEAKDEAIRLTGSRKSRSYEFTKDTDIMAEIIESAGLRGSVEETLYVHPQLVQYNATDWDFLVMRAEANGMFVLTDDGKVEVRKPDSDRDPSFLVSYGENLLDLEAEMDIRNQYEHVTTGAWDYQNQEIKISEPGNNDFNLAGNITTESLASILRNQVNITYSGKPNPQELQTWANALDLRSKMAKNAGRFRIHGNAALKPGNMAELKGVGDRFNGKTIITGIKHIYNGDWITECQFGWVADPFHEKENIMAPPAEGLKPGINGLHIGVVEDNDDPGGEHRIKVTIPDVFASVELWARLVMPDAGSNRGVYFHPQIGDEVILGFLNDDPDYPVILGSLYSPEAHEPPLSWTEKKETGFVTGSGSNIVFNDEDKSITISVTGNDGVKKIVLNDSGDILLADGSGNKMTMNQSGISIESSAIITIKGQIVKIN